MNIIPIYFFKQKKTLLCAYEQSDHEENLQNRLILFLPND
jgi:hypothetical protein